ncbi:photosystem II assembly protein Psb35 [Leptothermofonsia sp. ETS-13]|uniref:photosystem II assembly protein Psb35 n=1 Tax=Leptothermofonsia sp. ETS-13 TaxID=3035696 RepID=UPI003B9E2634
MNVVLATVSAAGHFPVAFTAVYVVGFIAAVTIGSIAWYNSKRPAGWEDKERPDFVPKVKDDHYPDS